MTSSGSDQSIPDSRIFRLIDNWPTQRFQSCNTFQRRRNAAVHAEVCVLDDSRERHVGEHLTKSIEKRLRVVRENVSPEAIRGRNRPRLVVPAKEREVTGELECQREKKQDALEREAAAVDIVPEEKIGPDHPPTAENAHEIVKTTVDVTNNADFGLDSDDNRQELQMRHHHLAERDHLRNWKFGKRHGPANFEDVLCRGENCIEAWPEEINSGSLHMM
jgi:hypothetical protein